MSKTISVCVQITPYKNKIVHFSLGEQSSYFVGYKSIDIIPNMDQDRLQIESPIYRGSTTDDDLKFFVKAFPILRDHASECDNLARFLLSLPKVSGYRYQFYTYTVCPKTGDKIFKDDLTVNDLILEVL